MVDIDLNFWQPTIFEAIIEDTSYNQITFVVIEVVPPIATRNIA
jgi:hypothetical protein